MSQPKRILVVDDKEFTRRGLKAFLAPYPNYQVVGEAQNGQEAVQWVNANAVDVIIMDINMPLMNGLQATQRIRQLQLPVKIIAWSISPSNRGAALAAGADTFVSKVESPETLLNALEAVSLNIPAHVG
jgi:DNA-binding NarL/FixJ family response regulator